MPCMRSMHSLHSRLYFLEEWRGIVYGRASEDYSNSWIRLVYLMYALGFLVGGAPYDEHEDVLRPPAVRAVVPAQRRVQVFSKLAFD